MFTALRDWKFSSAMIILALGVGFIFTGGTRAWAQEMGIHLPSKQHLESHAKGHGEYSKWKRPDTLGSCCDAKVWQEKDGHMSPSGHCYEAPNAVLIEGDWFVQFDTGQWFKVPASKILHNKEGTPNPAVAHICENYWVTPQDPILCFREPVGAI